MRYEEEEAEQEAEQEAVTTATQTHVIECADAEAQVDTPWTRHLPLCKSPRSRPHWIGCANGWRR
jgi:hypothetical protein